MHISNQIRSFTYLGGKFSILPWLIPILEENRLKHFVDVMGGSGVVMLNMKPAAIETYNDLNSEIVTFFKILRSTPRPLIDQLILTPYSRQEYADAWFKDEDSDLEKARKFFIRTQQSMFAAGAHEKMKGWAIATHQSRVKISERVHKWIRSVEGLEVLIERLRMVQIENRDFRRIFSIYNNSETFFYVDPPYDLTLRSTTRYKHDFKQADFFDLYTCAKEVKGKIAISGYDTPFMRDLFKEFNFRQGPLRKNSRSDKEAYESLWTNF